MAREIDLLGYWMPVLRQLKEFKEIAKAETPELKYILEQIERTLNNMFIETADEYGIKRFEDMMGIYPEAGASLETRRFNVLVKWNDKVPYTEKERCAIGPSICQDCYEVSGDVAVEFERAFAGHEHEILIAKENGKYQLDLWKANEIVLLDAGVLPEHIEITDICTCCNPDLLFSHRASHGKRGNLGAFLCLK